MAWLWQTCAGGKLLKFGKYRCRVEAVVVSAKGSPAFLTLTDVTQVTPANPSQLEYRVFLLPLQRKGWHWICQRSGGEGDGVQGSRCGDSWEGWRPQTREGHSRFLLPPPMAGFPLAFLVTSHRTGAVGNLLLLPY